MFTERIEVFKNLPELIQPLLQQILSKSILQHWDPKCQLYHLSWGQELGTLPQVYLSVNNSLRMQKQIYFILFYFGLVYSILHHTNTYIYSYFKKGVQGMMGH